MQLRSKECPYSFSAIELINDLMPQFPYTHTYTKESIEVKQLNLIKALFWSMLQFPTFFISLCSIQKGPL